MLNILLASSEVRPFAKTGGLADVCGALPAQLQRLGHRVTVFTPAYRQAKASGQEITETGIELEVPVGNVAVHGRLLRSQLPDSQVTVYLVDQPDYFDRPALYREDGEDYKDNCARFVFFCRAVLDSIRLLDLPVDLIHANDWQTGLLPAYLKVEYSSVPGYEQIASLLTIHNMAYQGQFWHWDMLLTGLDWKYFNWHQMEFYGHLNLLKTGIVFADAINTVSPRYAQEIQRAPLGCGLENVLHHRRHVLSGIINGVDYSLWSPEQDTFLPTQYGPENWQAGKAACKAYLQQELHLPQQPDVPLIGIIGRLADQKGFDLIARMIDHWAQRSETQWAILGTGEPEYHRLLSRLAGQYPANVSLLLEFSDRWAHLIEAAADIFLMPSRFEPCGLNQLYSLKYGTIPVVHATGGLADTIVDVNNETLAAGRANGFAFSSYDTVSLEDTLQRACQMYAHDRERWNRLVTAGMRQDWSWAQSARRYIELYQSTIARATQTICA